MDKNVRPYKQKGDTCAIACMMMVLEYYKLIEKANWYDEKRYYRLYGSKYMSGTPFAALAYHFSKNGLNTTLCHSEKHLFNNRKMVLSTENFNSAMNEYKEYLDRAESKGANIVNGIEINSQLLRKKLEEGNLIILAGEVSGVYHAILLSGYSDNNFIVCDPLYKTKQVKSQNEIDNFLDTDIGKWFIMVNDITKEHNNLIGNLDKYNEDAKKMMGMEEVKRIRYEKK